MYRVTFHFEEIDDISVSNVKQIYLLKSSGKEKLNLDDIASVLLPLGATYYLIGHDFSQTVNAKNAISIDIVKTS